MDGWGEAPESKYNAITMANTPFVDSLWESRPHSLLNTSGENVGLPEGQMGNSEVGHLNIGAGRVVFQELALINKAIKEKIFFENQILVQAIEYAKMNGKALHLIGLVSDGGVHSHLNHLAAICQLAHEHGLDAIFIHAFTDGRDTDPQSGLECILNVLEQTKGTSAVIASVVGRYYAMDRDKRWERVKKAYDLMVHGVGEKATDVFDAIRNSYNKGVTDEFINPIVITTPNGRPLATIGDGDAVICFNFRTDRCREITEVLTQGDMPDFEMKKLKLHYVTMTNYDDRFQGVRVLFQKQNLSNTLGEVLEKAGCSQVRIAETEKYPHVTFFFSGGREKEFAHERRIMIPSPKVATYDLKPSMSAIEVTDAIIKEMEDHEPDFICLNYANVDMVGHSGVFGATIEAVETVDACVKKVVDIGLPLGYSFLITSDHGNADKLMNEDGSPNTAHTTNPVPLFYVSGSRRELILKDGRLADLAPTILNIMDIEVPVEMDGRNLLEVKK